MAKAQDQLWSTNNMITRATLFAVACASLAFGCSSDMTPAEEQAEIIDNLIQAGYPADEILVQDGLVYAGRDAVVSLEGSREMLVTDGDAKEQYRTSNLMGSGVTKVCVNPSSRFVSNSDLMAGLQAAVDNYNSQGLTFQLAIGPTTGCSANISMVTQGGTSSSAGFPSGGLPYPGPVYIGTGTARYGAGPVKHVIEHELGHCIGFRHSDYYNRSISCGAGGNEGDAGVGAILIPGTPSTAVRGGSVYNSCYSTTSTGVFTSSDVTALQYLY
jgi:hypothetical protein